MYIYARIKNTTKIFVSSSKSVVVDAFDARRRRQEGGRQSAGDSRGQGREGAAGEMRIKKKKIRQDKELKIALRLDLYIGALSFEL